jgi:hypothetical protein
MSVVGLNASETASAFFISGLAKLRSCPDVAGKEMKEPA